MCLYENDPNEIHMLIGADFAGRLLTGEIKQITENLVAIHTRLGWTLMGESGENTRRCETLLSLHVSDLDISELWRLDTIGIKDLGENQSKRELEEDAKLHFLENVKRDHEGRYMVGKLSDYEEVFNEWENEDIIEKVESHQEIDEEHYLPHRPVFKENSTTKVRPVFDGSAKEKNSPSINDCLEKGPNLIELIPSLINRFRFGKFGVIADIKKAVLQIGLQERDRPFLRFLWREKGKNDNITVYQHNRVVFGISSSPFLLGATIEFHLKNAPDYYKETAHTLLESFYVDNLVCSVNSKEKLDKLIVESQEILEEGKFELRGWEHNNLDPQTENTVPTERRSVPVLGLKWDLDQDLLSVDIKVHESKNEILTKRKILSLVHKIFDPIGFTCPATLIPKIMLQECWTLKVKWDSELPASIWQKFQKWKDQLDRLKAIAVPRCMIEDPETSQNLSLHVFCDASKAAYATCIFLRSENENSASCQLVQARSRVAPLKSISIPRLELLACTIGARLARTVKEDLKLPSLPVFYWSDSTNALYWIKKSENWAVFVSNRVKEIRNLSNPDDWYYVPGSKNPADLPSRGCSVDVLAKSKWREGPDWLRGPPKDWPIKEIYPDFEIVNAEKERQSLPPPIRRQTNLNSSMTYHLLEKLFESWHTCYDFVTT
ncbi:integrase catalytic domain-containing protein [Trichonephila clavipes]|nr:integrase catalytic domain-containing protein [Trichonephila clavipes]